MNFDYIRKYYGVPACIGRGVVVDGKPGVITEDRGAYIGVVFDGSPANDVRPCHPDSMVVYGDMRSVPKMTRSQQRYHDYLNADCGLSFREWLTHSK